MEDITRRVIPKLKGPQYDPFVPFEQGGITCGNCGSVLPHAAYLGQQKGPNFHVSGYKCPNCEYQYGEGSVFEWWRLSIPRNCSYQGGRD